MVSAALQPNLANVSMAFFLCSALYILMVLPVLFLVQDFHRSPPVDKKLTKRTVPDARQRSMRPAHMSRPAA